MVSTSFSHCSWMTLFQAWGKNWSWWLVNIPGVFNGAWVWSLDWPWRGIELGVFQFTLRLTQLLAWGIALLKKTVLNAFYSITIVKIWKKIFWSGNILRSWIWLVYSTALLFRQALGKVYEVLKDKDQRAIYDEQGIVDEESDILTQDRNWEECWRALFPKVGIWLNNLVWMFSLFTDHRLPTCEAAQSFTSYWICYSHAKTLEPYPKPWKY